ncbi:MAG TPA: pyridoxamine 5'-phosphate oxidase family protein [Actinomycetota bacterium]|nr:pyridoxamine 5'-phosphate oxidase family protein [Actinomycetota bacterium]
MELQPQGEHLKLPPGYGNPSKRLVWETVSKKLHEAQVYWFATTRPDGRPHVVPRDGIWLDDQLFYGGSAETVHHRNVEFNGAAAAHIGDGQEAIIVEGVVTVEIPAPDLAKRLADATTAKYPQYGKAESSAYKDGVWVLRPGKVMAWTSLPVDATRFVFEGH